MGNMTEQQKDHLVFLMEDNLVLTSYRKSVYNSNIKWNHNQLEEIAKHMYRITKYLRRLV